MLALLELVRAKMITRYAVAYDRHTGATITLGDFRDEIDAGHLLLQLRAEGRANVRLQSRQVTKYEDVSKQPPAPSRPLYEQHPYRGPEGLIGGNCLTCGGPVVEPWHRGPVPPIKEAVR